VDVGNASNTNRPAYGGKGKGGGRAVASFLKLTVDSRLQKGRRQLRFQFGTSLEGDPSGREGAGDKRPTRARNKRKNGSIPLQRERVGRPKKKKITIRHSEGRRNLNPTGRENRKPRHLFGN